MSFCFQDNHVVRENGTFTPKRSHQRRRRFRKQRSKNEIKEFDDGWIVGNTIYFLNGDRYVGPRNDNSRDQMHGNGTYFWRDGREYRGQFLNGLKEGNGEFSGTDLSKYIGEFTKDKMEGHGRLNMPDGQVYIGDFEDWKRKGSGNLTWRNGDFYLGVWNDNEGNISTHTSYI